jgi:hypothetical protein
LGLIAKKGEKKGIAVIFNIVNPSDKYTLETDDFETACIVAIFLGNGMYSLEQLDGDLEMQFFFGDPSGWFQEVFGNSFEVSVKRCLTEKQTKLIEALDSVLIGDRKMYYEGLALIDNEEKRKEWRMKWHDRNRSSMNDIGGRAWAIAEKLRRKLKPEEGEDQ